jgi:hypothetical protein
MIDDARNEAEVVVVDPEALKDVTVVKCGTGALAEAVAALAVAP